jgi:hypothetical protein
MNKETGSTGGSNPSSAGQSMTGSGDNSGHKSNELTEGDKQRIQSNQDKDPNSKTAQDGWGSRAQGIVDKQANK